MTDDINQTKNDIQQSSAVDDVKSNNYQLTNDFTLGLISSFAQFAIFCLLLIITSKTHVSSYKSYRSAFYSCLLLLLLISIGNIPKIKQTNAYNYTLFIFACVLLLLQIIVKW